MAERDITGAVDFAYLETYAGHDPALVEEVLAMFVEQAQVWLRLLDPRGEGFRDAAHTLKGASLGLGARDLAAACDAAEAGHAQPLGEREVLTARVRDALATASADIAAYRHQKLLDGLRAR